MSRRSVLILRPLLRSIHLATITLLAASPFARRAATAVETAVPGIETAAFRLSLTPQGRCEIRDRKAKVTWAPADGHIRFGTVTLNAAGQTRRVDLTNCVVQVSGNELTASFHVFPAAPTTVLRVRARALDEKTLEISYQEDHEMEVVNLTLLEDVLGVTREGKGYVVVPVREGLMVPADSGLGFSHRFDSYAYEGCHMLMLGAVQEGAAALVTWDDPYTAAELKSVVHERGSTSPSAEANSTTVSASVSQQRVTPSLVLSKSGRSFRIQFLGRGDYVSIGTAYREVARCKGWLVTWDEKLKTDPERGKLFGAANIKLWSTLDRRMNEASTQEESVRVNWTFAEAAEVAEHLKRDLKLDRVLFTMGGWIHRGYDNQHPDILPTAPECGGDAAFADCARRVRDLGYLFCLHDNYQDIYRDSPSWDEKWVMKTADGKVARGGHWAGGMAYLTCSKPAVELARRPQNLEAVRQLSRANAYFIDTTYAAGLQECFDPAHPLTRSDDMRAKQELSDYARQVFGVFGSECGREWAIPHSDFFEGLTGVSGGYYHDAKLAASLGAAVVPLFDLVYRDCIAMYGKYGYNPRQAASYVLHHVSLGRPLNYHSIPSHRYWKQGPGQRGAEESAALLGTGEGAALFTRADGGWAEGLHPMDRFIKNTCEVLCPLNEMTARLRMTRHEFLTPDRKVQRTVFGDGVKAVEVVINEGNAPYTCNSKLGGRVDLPPYGLLVDSASFVAFHASNWNGIAYASPPLFTLRSLDGHPLAKSYKTRVFHGFGSDQIRVGQVIRTVPKEGEF